MNNVSKVPISIPRTSSDSSGRKGRSDSGSLHSGSVTKQKDSKNLDVSDQLETTSSLYVEVLGKPEDEEISSFFLPCAFQGYKIEKSTDLFHR